MLATLIEKVNKIEKVRDFSLEDDWEDDSHIDWLSWVEMDLPEDLSINEDPDYMPPILDQHVGTSQNFK